MVNLTAIQKMKQCLAEIEIEVGETRLQNSYLQKSMETYHKKGIFVPEELINLPSEELGIKVKQLAKEKFKND